MDKEKEYTSASFASQKDAVFTSAEAAAYLRISTRTLQTLRETEIGPDFFKVKGSYRYTKAALDKYISVQTQVAQDGRRKNRYK